jgi:CheY-specific phosphatase CheX
MLTELVTPESLEVQVSVAQQAFATLAEMPVFLSREPASFANESELIFAASLRYLGECNGCLRLECSPAMAYAFTEHLIIGSKPSSLDSDVKDAIGELVNTIGGNLKGLLPAGVRLNTPKVSAEKPLDAMRTKCLSCLTFNSQFGSFRLLLSATEAN